MKVRTIVQLALAAFVAILAVTACDPSLAPSSTDATIADTRAYVAPYTLTKFQNAISESKLQAPTSSTASEMPGLKTYASSYFHVASNDTTKMEFYQSGSSNRTELRHLQEWKTSTSTARTAYARLKLQSISSDLDEFTFLQIHDSGDTPNKPLIRMVWIRDRNGVKSHIWAVRRTSVSSSNYTYTDCGAMGTNYFTVKMTVQSNTLKIYVNDSLKVNTSVSYWSNLYNYFKAGVYLQDSGNATVRFDQLTW